MNSSTTQRSKTDRIERAARLIEQGRVTPMGEGRWHVQSDTQAMGYGVTIEGGCYCYDYIETLKCAEPCKHIWAAIGAAAALLIHDLRQAITVGQLERIGKQYAEGMRLLPEAFIEVARAEYKHRYSELTGTQPSKEQCRAEEAVAIIVKPQPKSSGRIGGIEI